MTEQQANDLAARIKAQFPHVFVHAVPAIDTRNAPRHWFVAVKRAPLDSPALIVHNEFEWQEALTALRVLNA